MKKGISLLLAGVLAVSLVACGGESSSEPPEESTMTEEEMLAEALSNLAKRPVYTTLELDGRTFGASTARYITPAQQRAVKIRNMVNGVKS